MILRVLSLADKFPIIIIIFIVIVIAILIMIIIIIASTGITPPTK